jgi:hypothetical protein
MRTILLALAAVLLAPTANATEQPEYTVLEKDGRLELRVYDALIVASVEVEADRGKAANNGFGPLADYIFGANRDRAGIDMTTPVIQSPARASSQKIDMTAPVLQSETSSGKWMVSFVMPRKWTMSTLPEPENPKIMLQERPPETLAAIRFSGVGGPKTQLAQQAELEAWIATRGWTVSGPPRVAFYNPPWTPPPLRRNEILIPVSTDTAG